jgi:hypothetical protein
MNKLKVWLKKFFNPDRTTFMDGYIYAEACIIKQSHTLQELFDAHRQENEYDRGVRRSISDAIVNGAAK